VRSDLKLLSADGHLPPKHVCDPLRIPAASGSMRPTADLGPGVASSAAFGVQRSFIPSSRSASRRPMKPPYG
jgi:hypothetical protein